MKPHSDIFNRFTFLRPYIWVSTQDPILFVEDGGSEGLGVG